jgi:hypothetical protein
MRRLTALCVVWAIGLVLAAIAAADHPGRGGTPFFATLTPEAECNTLRVCGLGQPGAAGETSLRLNSGQQEVCFKTAATGLATPVTGAHIHRAPAGVPGPIVVPLSPSVGDGCVFAPRELIKEIRKNPENFYVNVHTTEFRGGAIRGQLCGPGRGNC